MQQVIQWSLIGLGVTLLVYGAFVAVLVLAGRREAARAVADFVPACALLFARLVRDPRTPRRHRVLLVLIAAYLASPIDLVPDFVPVAGQLDDAIIVAAALRTVVRHADPQLLREHWAGSDQSFGLLLRLAGWVEGGGGA
jgi:uncharacterized membrane protein YkvA (DUF1232 family)